jgi:phosphoribosyl 1,2-cyclic phosphodiesterase
MPDVRSVSAVGTPAESPPRETAASVVCWGTRGSVPTPGAQTVQFGGNTSCIEVRTRSGHRLIFDAGTGIIPLGHRLAVDPESPFELFLSHFHWDHLQGLPFFAPLLDPRATVRIHGPAESGAALEAILHVQMRRPFSPVSLQEMPARTEYLPFTSPRWTDGDVVVTAFPVRHPDHTHGFRIETADATLVYIPDNEPEWPDYPLVSSWPDTIAAFIHGADLLIHDAMFIDTEYETRHGWGHGTVGQAIQLATVAQVGQLVLFHHHPERTDEQLRNLERSIRGESPAKSNLVISVAAEGRELVLR